MRTFEKLAEKSSKRTIMKHFDLWDIINCFKNCNQYSECVFFQNRIELETPKSAEQKNDRKFMAFTKSTYQFLVDYIFLNYKMNLSKNQKRKQKSRMENCQQFDAINRDC